MIEWRIGLGLSERVLVEIEIVAEGVGFAEGPLVSVDEHPTIGAQVAV